MRPLLASETSGGRLCRSGDPSGDSSGDASECVARLLWLLRIACRNDAASGMSCLLATGMRAWVGSAPAGIREL